MTKTYVELDQTYPETDEQRLPLSGLVASRASGFRWKESEDGVSHLEIYGPKGKTLAILSPTRGAFDNQHTFVLFDPHGNFFDSNR